MGMRAHFTASVDTFCIGNLTFFAFTAALNLIDRANKSTFSPRKVEVMLGDTLSMLASDDANEWSVICTSLILKIRSPYLAKINERPVRNMVCYDRYLL